MCRFCCISPPFRVGLSYLNRPIIFVVYITFVAIGWNMIKLVSWIRDLSLQRRSRQEYQSKFGVLLVTAKEEEFSVPQNEHVFSAWLNYLSYLRMTLHWESA